MSTNDAVIVSAVRTPVGIGKPQKGVLSGIHPVDLSATILNEVTGRVGLDPALVDELLAGASAADPGSGQHLLEPDQLGVVVSHGAASLACR